MAAAAVVVVMVDVPAGADGGGHRSDRGVGVGEVGGRGGGVMMVDLGDSTVVRRRVAPVRPVDAAAVAPAAPAPAAAPAAAPERMRGDATPSKVWVWVWVWCGAGDLGGSAGDPKQAVAVGLAPAATAVEAAAAAVVVALAAAVGERRAADAVDEVLLEEGWDLSRARTRRRIEPRWPGVATHWGWGRFHNHNHNHTHTHTHHKQHNGVSVT